MSAAESISLTGLLYYIYNRFAVTYLMCFLGVMIGRVVQVSYSNNNKKKHAPINGTYLALQGALITVIMCALQDYLKIESFNIYVLFCVLFGVWSPMIVGVITNIKFVKHFIVNISKKIKDPVIEAVGETIDQCDVNDKSKSKNKDKDGAS